MSATSTCSYCGETFEHDSWKDREYCDKSCAGKAREAGNRETSTCLNCNEDFVFYPSRTVGIFCSKECQVEGQRRDDLDVNEVRSETRDEARAYRAKHEGCELCDVTAALEVHHIEPVADNPDKADDEDNMMAICVRCHASIDDDREINSAIGQKEMEWRRSLVGPHNN
jgi:5-methylcytosine-specific restriction endonuclease McrA